MVVKETGQDHRAGAVVKCHCGCSGQAVMKAHDAERGVECTKHLGYMTPTE